MTEIVIRMLQEMRTHLDGRFEQIDSRFAQIDARFAQIDERFEVIEGALLTLAEQNRFIVKHLETQARRQGDIEQRVDRLERNDET